MKELFKKLISKKRPVQEKKSLLYNCPYCNEPTDFLQNHQCKTKQELKKPLWKIPQSRRKVRRQGRPPYKK